MCCNQPYWVQDKTVAICRSCGSTKVIAQPYVYPSTWTNPYIPPVWTYPVITWGNNPTGGTDYGKGSSIGGIGAYIN